MAVVTRKNPNILNICNFMRDEEKLDRFCENCGLAPKTQPPGIVGGSRDAAPANPVLRQVQRPALQCRPSPLHWNSNRAPAEGQEKGLLQPDAMWQA